MKAQKIRNLTRGIRGPKLEESIENIQKILFVNKLNAMGRRITLTIPRLSRGNNNKRRN
jgi:hypothetical protein